MAGLRAGSIGAIEIEMYANLARLSEDVRQAQALIKTASASMAGSMSEADKAIADAGLSMRQLQREAQNLRDKIDPLGPAQRAYAQELKNANALVKSGIIDEQEYAKAVELAESKLDLHTAALKRNGTMSGSTSMGMMVLGEQLRQVGTEYALGIKPMQIFAQQSGQVIQSVSLMASGTEGFIGWLAGPWGIATTAAVAALAPLVAGLISASDATKKVTFATYDLGDAQDILGKLMDIQTGKIKDQSTAMEGLARAQALSNLATAQAQQLAAKQGLASASQPERMYGGGLGGGFSISRVATPATQAVGQYMAGISLSDDQAKQFGLDETTIVNKLGELQKAGRITTEQMQTALKAVTDYGTAAANAKWWQTLQDALNGDKNALKQFQDALGKQPKADKHAEELAREAQALAQLTAGLLDAADAYKVSSAAGQAAEITAQSMSDATKKQADGAAMAAGQVAKWAAQQLLSGRASISALQDENDARHILNNQVAQGLLTAQQADDELKIQNTLRPLQIALALAHGKAVGQLTEALKDYRKVLEDANAEDKRQQEIARQAAADDNLAEIQKEIELQGQLGAARVAALMMPGGATQADALAKLDLEHQNALVLAKAQIEADRQRAQGLSQEADDTLKAAAAQVELNNEMAKWQQAERDIANVNDELSQMFDVLKQIGGIAGEVGGLMQGLLSGNFAGLGAVGQILNLALVTPKDDLGKQVDRLALSIQKFTGASTELSGDIAKAVQGIAYGSAASAAVFGTNQSTAQQLGSTFGSVAGQMLGTKFLSSLGAAAGPIGAIGGALIGTIAGSLVGKLFGSAKYGNYSSTGGLTGNDADSQSAASSLGTSLQSGLQSIADQLGLTLGNYQTSIGVTDGKYRYSTTGRTGELKSGYSDVTVTGTGDAGQAAAIEGAMKDAIKDGALQGLSEADKEYLLKAGDFDSALTDVLNFHSILDSVTASVSPFEASLTSLQKTFADQVALYQKMGATTEQLTQLQASQQSQLDALVTQASSQYLSTFGTTAQQVAAAKKTISDTLTPLGYGSVDTVAEYTRLVNATDPLKDPELYGALMNLADAFGTLKQASDDAAQAAAAQKAAEAALAQQQQSLQVQILQAQGKDAEATALQRQMDLAAADKSLQPLLQDLYKAQDIASARDDLAQAYDTEKSSLQSTIDAAKSLSDSLKDVRDSIYDTSNSASSYATLLAKLRSVGTMAAMGDQTAAGQLGGVIQDFLPAAKANAQTALEYQRAQALAARYADSAISAQDAAADIAQQQLDKLTDTVTALGAIDTSVESVEDAIDKLTALLGGSSSSGSGSSNQQTPADDKADKRQQRIEDLLNRLLTTQQQGTVSQNGLLRLLKNFEHKGFFGVSIVNDETADA